MARLRMKQYREAAPGREALEAEQIWVGFYLMQLQRTERSIFRLLPLPEGAKFIDRDYQQPEPTWALYTIFYHLFLKIIFIAFF